MAPHGRPSEEPLWSLKIQQTRIGHSRQHLHRVMTHSTVSSEAMPRIKALVAPSDSLKHLRVTHHQRHLRRHHPNAPVSPSAGWTVPHLPALGSFEGQVFWTLAARGPLLDLSELPPQSPFLEIPPRRWTLLKRPSSRPLPSLYRNCESLVFFSNAQRNLLRNYIELFLRRAQEGAKPR